MKQILTILSLLITSIAFSQQKFTVKVKGDGSVFDSTQVNSKLAGKQNVFMINVKDYGAIGDSSTDNTIAIQAAYDAVTDNNTVVYFPTGKYLISDSIVISKSCITQGQGGLMPYYYVDTMREKARSQIIQIDATKSVFIVNDEGCQFDNIAVIQSSASVPTGYGIKFNHGNSMRMTNVSVSNFYYNTWLVNGFYWSIDKCEFINAYKNNLRLEHQVYKDGGDATIINSYFVGGRYDSLVHLHYRSGGGLKMLNDKFQNGIGTQVPDGMIDVNIEAPGTSIFLIANCSFEKFKTFGIKVRKDNGASYGKIKIEGNQLYSISAVPNSAIDIQGYGPGAGLITGVIVANNIITVSNDDSAAIRLGYVYIGNVSGNVIDNSTNKYKFTNVIQINNEIPADLTVGGKSYYSVRPNLSTADSLVMTPKRYVDSSVSNISTVPSGFSVNPTGAATMLVGNAMSFNSYAATTGGGMAYNIYLDSTSGWKYRNNGTGMVLWGDAAGGFTVYTAPSGTAGATASITSRFTVTNTGDVRVLSLPNGGAGAFVTNSSGYLRQRTSAEVRTDLSLYMTGTTAPSTTPAFIGQEFLDTTNKKLYKAFGTSSSADWVIQN